MMSCRLPQLLALLQLEGWLRVWVYSTRKSFGPHIFRHKRRWDS